MKGDGWQARGKTVLVTGAGSGIGRAAALAFAELGCTVLPADIDPPSLAGVEEELSRVGSHGKAYLVDISDNASVGEMASSVIREFGVPDVLVNVAGVCLVADIVDTTPEDWDRLISVNLKGAINVVTPFLPGMKSRKSGHVVNVSSGAGLFGLAALGAYSTTKFALVGFSEALQQELREDGIGVTVVCPGGIDTPILENMPFRGYSRSRLLGFVRFFLRHSMKPQKMARLIVDAVRRNRFLVAPSVFVRLHYHLKRLSPALFRMTTRGGRFMLRNFFKED